MMSFFRKEMNMSNFQDNIEKCVQINRFVNLLSKGNIYNLDFDQQEFILDNNINANYLLTFDQWNDKGARVLKGSKSIRLPHNNLVFDVQQTNYRLTSDEEFPQLSYDLKSTSDFENINTIIDSFISDNRYDENHIQYNSIINAIIEKRFLNKEYIAENEIRFPDDVDLQFLSETTNKVFNLIKSIYNDIKYSSNDSISFSKLLEYAIDNELGGKYYGTRNDQYNEDETRILERESTMDVSEDERQWDTISTSRASGGSISGELGESTGSNETRLQQEQPNTSTRAAMESDGDEERTVLPSSKGDSSSRDIIQTDRGIEKSDNEIAFSNYQDFAIHMPSYGYVKISEGTGDNLLLEDRQEGYVDYINYSIYSSLEDMYDDNEQDGGMMLLRDYYVSMFHKPSDVVNYLIDTNELPNLPYDIVAEELDSDIVYSTEQLSLFDSIKSVASYEQQQEIIDGQISDLQNKADYVYDESIDRLSDDFTTTTHIIGSQYIENVISGIENIPIQNKTFDELNDDERLAVENDDELYLSVYNNSVDKGYEITTEMKDFINKYPYGSQDGIKDAKNIKVLAKWFSPVGAGTWIATECDGFDSNGDPLLYGCCTLGYGWEWGYLPLLSELKSMDLGAQFGHLRIERDRGVDVGDSLYKVLKSTDSTAFDDLNLQENNLTNDQQIDIDLLSGSGFSEGKFRIYELFTNAERLDIKPNQIADLLKKEYGIGGGTGADNTNIRFHNYDSKGIVYSFNSNAADDSTFDIKLSWSDVSKRVKRLIDEGLYLSNDELQAYTLWQQSDHYSLLPDLNLSQIATTKNQDSLDSDAEYDYEGINVEVNPIIYEYSDQVDVDNDYVKPDLVKITNSITGKERIVEKEKLNDIALQYDNDVADMWSGIFDVASAQDTADTFNRPVIDGDTTYLPENGHIVIKPYVEPIDYHISDEQIGVGTPLERFNNNINAIELLRMLEAEDRNATPEEQDILAKYVGWGGLADFFDESKRNEEAKQLKNLLSDTEYASARESTLSAFYTQPIIIDTIYNALDKFGFKGGNVLEPSCGVGNFFGRLPDSMSDSKLYGVELDSISSRIAKKLYPNANIETKGFENTTFDDNFFDVAIGNVPFGDFSVMDKRYDKYNFKIHDYFFAKTIDKVRSGGIIAFITSKGTMDKLNSKAREYIAERCDLIGSVRLPKEAFKAAAGTETVSDIIFLAKRDTPRVNMPSWTKSVDTNFMNIDYFNRYMSKDDIDNEIISILENKDFDTYNALVKYVNKLEDHYWVNEINKDYYNENNLYSGINSRWINTRENVINRWKTKWNNQYGSVNSNTDYDLDSYGGVELYRWFKDDPDEVIRIVAESGKFDRKAKTYDEKLDLAREFLTVSDRSIDRQFRLRYVESISQSLINDAKAKDNKQGQYLQPINNYFVENKDMILGQESIETSRFGFDYSVSLNDESSLKEKLNSCLNNLEYQYIASDKTIDEKEKNSIKVLPADMSIKNFSYGIIDDDIYYRNNSVMQLIPKTSSNYTLLKDTIILNNVYKAVINAQLKRFSDDELKIRQNVLNDTYDKYVENYGRIYNLQKKLKEFITNDNSLDRITSLENYDVESKKFIGKADIFTQRTIYSGETVIEHCETSFDALLVSLRTRLKVDLELMSQLTNKPIDNLINDLKGAIYRNHESEGEFVSADEYLSGNVKQKLKDVERLYSSTLQLFDKTNDLDEKQNLQSKLDWLLENKNALQEAQPIDLQPYEIDMPLGASWIPEDIIQRFAEDVILEGNFYRWNKPEVVRSTISKNWYIKNKTKIYNSSNLTEKYGLKVKGHNALDILESCLNLKREEVAFYVEDENGKKVRVVDKQKTLVAIQKQDLIKKEFTKWIKENEDIYNYLAQIYNDRFNCIVDRKYNPDLIDPVGLTKMINGKNIELYSHQKEAIAKALFGGNAGIFHSVGAGKTLTLIAIAMESKRLGLCNKSLFVVPKSIVGQWGKDFVNAYPNANVLVADEKSFTKDNRRRFINKIASGNYDAIIISNEQFKLLKLSDERVISYINEDIERIQEFIAENKYNSGKNWSVKQAESVKKKLENRIKKRNEMAKDDFIDFEELGIDKLFIDESHNFKNLAFETSLSRVKGIGSSADAQKSNDLYYKTRYLNQLTDNKGIVFATGTPISNYLAEMFTIQRYLQPDTLRYMDVDNFDSWVSVFGEIVEEQQLDVTGTKYTPKAVLKRYHNLPELMAAFRQVADIRTKDTLDMNLPDVERINVEVPRTDEQKEYLDELNERLDKIRNNQVDPTEDNMLLITNDGRKMALDQRLIGKPITDDERVKANYVIDNVYNEYLNSSNILGTQAIFSDLSTPNSDKWNVYSEIKKGLIEKGIPESEIQFIHDFEKQKDKEKLFKLINEGKVRVVLGSTQKLGTGVNMQQRMVALHHIDVPWKPSDIEQREGRAVRQGNTSDNVKIYRYITADTFDAYSWQIIENKATFISQIMTNKNPARTCDDLNDDEVVLDAAQIKAIATGNPLIKERMILENDIKKLNISRQEYLKGKARLKESIAVDIPNEIAYRKDNISRLENDISKYTKPDVVLNDNGKEEYLLDIIINNKHFTDYKDAGEELHNMASIIKYPDDQLTIAYKGKVIGKYQDFDIRVAAGSKLGEIIYSVGDQWINKTTKYESSINTIKKLISSLDEMESNLDYQKDSLQKAQNNLDSSKKLLDAPFEYEQELKEKEARLNEIVESMDNAANYSSDESLDGRILYDEKGNIIDEYDSEDEYDDEYEMGKEL